MIQVHGRPNSVNVQKVMWCLAELGLEVDRTDIGGVRLVAMIRLHISRKTQMERYLH